MSEFSLELSEDQLQIQKWVHDFAEDVIRPAAHEWDEREETPWPIIEEAARIGLYSFDFMAQCFFDPGGLMLPIANEELAWGDAGIGLAIFGSALGPRRHRRQRDARAAGRVGPPVLRHAREDPAGRVRGVGARRRLRRELAAHPGRLRRGQGRVGDQRHQDLDHQRWDRRPARGRGRGRPRARLAGPGQLHRAARRPRGSRQGQKFKKMGIRASHTGEVVLDDVRVPGHCLLGGKEKLDAKLARAREGKRSNSQAAMATFEATRPSVGAQALGISRAAYEYALDYAKERKAFGRLIIENQGIAFKLADMKMRIDASRLLVWRAAWMGRTGKPFEAGEGSMSKLYAGETAVWVTEQAIQIMGGYGYIREHPVERWHRDSKIYTIFEGTSEIQRLIIARAVSGIHIV